MKRFVCAFLFAFLLLACNQSWAQTLTSGTFVTNTISATTYPTPQDKKTYYFTLTAGQAAAINGYSPGWDVNIQVTPPGGSPAGIYNQWSTNSAPATGTYTVDVYARNRSDSGTFKLYYFAAGEATSEGAIDSGKSYTTTMPPNGLLSYSFTGTLGQAIAIQTAGGNFNTYIKLFSPSGTYINYTTNRWIPTSELTATGTYTLLVYPQTVSGNGPMTLQFLKAGDTTFPGLVKSGETRNSSLLVNGMQSYSFNGTAGEGFRIQVDAAYPVYIRVYTPDGAYWNVTGNRWNSNGMPQTGKYTVLVDAVSLTDSGPYSLYFFKGNSTVSDGFLVNGSAAWPGYLNKNGIESYTFSATAGNNLTVTTTGAISRTFLIYTPDGAYWTYGNTVKSITASVTGTYSVAMYGAYDTTEGDYTIAATSTPVATTASDQTKPLDGCAYTGNPINVDIGFKLQTDTDYDAAGLSFTRIYRSDSTWTNNTVGTLWRHNYARTLNVSGSTADITDGSGATTHYTLTGGNWIPDDPSTTSTFETISGGYKYTLHDGTVEKYDSTKKLTRIEYLGGGALNLVYNGSSQLTSVTNENGRSLTLSYSSGRVATVVTPDGTFSYSYTSGNLTTVTKPDTKTTIYHYENGTYPNALTGITDEKGVRFATFAYNAGGKAISTEHAGTVDKYSVAYNTNSSTTTNPLGKDTTYQFRNILGVRRVVQVDGVASANCVAANKHYNYDELGRTIGKTDWENNTTRYRYDSRSNVIEIIEAAGTSKQRITNISWIAGFNLPDVVSEPGLTTDYDYDIYGRLVTMTQTDTATAATRVTTYAYYSNGTDGSGNVILGRLQQVDGPRTDVSDITSYAYDGNYNLTTITNALSQVTTITARDAAGRPTTVQDANGINTVLTYDTNGWLQTATRASGTGLAALYDFDYDFNGNLVKVTLPNSVFVEYSYDNAQRLTGIKDSLNNTVTYTLNNAGDATKVEVKNSTPATTYVHDQAFDELSRLIRSIGAATPAQTAVLAYDKNSNLTSYTDPKANPATTYTYDALQRIATQTDSASGVTTLGYTGLGDLNSVKDQRNNTTSYTYNAFGDVLTETSPDRGLITYVVDKAGNVTKRTDALSVVRDYTYDALNRLLTVVYPAETALNATLSYDLSSGCGTPYKGHLCRVVDNTGTTNYQYDSLGRVTNVSETRGALTFTQSYTYDLAGNIATITMPSGRVVTYTRNANGLVSNVAAPINGSATNLASSITYLPFGPQNAMTYGNGKTFSATFDTDYNPTNRTVSGGLYNWTYTTDKNSNITQAGATTYGYDALDRVNAENPGTAASYTYDATSNRLTKTQGSTTTTTVPSTSNKISAVGGTSYTYDAAGNITAIGTNGYVWSAQGLMKEYKISGTTTGTYTYNAYNQRTKKVVSATTTHYVYGANGLMLGEYTTAGAMVREYIYLNNVPLAQVNSGSPETVTYIHTDHLGTPRFGTNSAGTSVWSWTNDAFGISAASGAATINLRMAGQYFDSESSLFYNWNRYYNPTIGRYISSDPIGIAGGDLNTFGYVGQNPVNWVDPSGLIFVDRNPDFGDAEIKQAIIDEAYKQLMCKANSATKSWFENQLSMSGLTLDDMFFRSGGAANFYYGYYQSTAARDLQYGAGHTNWGMAFWTEGPFGPVTGEALPGQPDYTSGLTSLALTEYSVKKAAGLFIHEAGQQLVGRNQRHGVPKDAALKIGSSFIVMCECEDKE